VTGDSGIVTAHSGRGRKSVTFQRNRRSRSSGTTGHVQAESVVTIARNTHYDDVFVENWLRVGDEGAGYRIALANLETGRIGIAAQSVRLDEAALEQALTYARERHAFGKPLSEHQAVAFRLADMATELEAAPVRLARRVAQGCRAVVS
jgi:alkylation response protein AidB-like acyl-CoA dehydrogenase